jgi:hypothetical protein
MEEYLERMSLKFPRLSHEILSMCSVEEFVETETKRKVPLYYKEDTLPMQVNNLKNSIFKKITHSQRIFYQKQSDFFRKVELVNP